MQYQKYDDIFITEHVTRASEQRDHTVIIYCSEMVY
jgi:hypothetical protein